MSEDNDSRFAALTYHRSRIPALDALTAFVSEDVEDPIVEAMAERVGHSRWYPEEGGCRVLIFYEGGPYDADRFTLEKGAWDHEHCKRCGGSIEPMTLCWVASGSLYVILCESCHVQIAGEETA